MQTFELKTKERLSDRMGQTLTEPYNVRLGNYRRKDGALVSVESYRPKRHQNQPNHFTKPV